MKATPFRANPDPEITTYVAVRTAAIPLSYPSINDSNNVIQITEIQSDTPKTFDVTIPPGQYDLISFVAAVNDAFTADSLVSGYGLTYEISVSTITGKATFTFATPSLATTTTINFGPPTTAQVILGFPDSGTQLFSDLLPYTAPNIISISGPKYIVIRSSSFNNENYETRVDSTSSILQSIPITGTQFTIQVYNPANPQTFSQIGSTVDSLQIEITDENGIQLNLQGQDIVIDLAVYEIGKIR